MMRRLTLLLLFIPAFALGQSAGGGGVSSGPALTTQRGTVLPAACAVGQLFFKTDATAGQNIYECTSANTWTQEGPLLGGTNNWSGQQTFSGSASLGASYLSTTKTASTAGTTANLLACFDGTTGNVTDCATATVGALGISVSTKASTNAVEVATRGVINCVADGNTTVGNLLGVGTVTAGRCKDLGAADSTAVSATLQIIGKALTASGGAGNAVSVQLYGPGHYGTQLVNPVYCTPQTLTDQASITWDANTCSNANLTLTASGHTLGVISNIKAGGTYNLTLIQGGSGSYTMAWNAAYKWPSGIAPTLSTAVGAEDSITCYSRDGTNLKCAFMGDMK